MHLSRILTTIFGVLAICLFMSSKALLAQDWDKVTINSESVTGNIYMLTGRGGNIGVLAGDDGVVMIDDQFAELSDKIRAAVGEISKADIRFLLNTHLHGDHTGGNENFANSGVAIVAHENVRERMSKEEFNRFSGRKRPAAPKAALPIVTFTQDVTFHLNGEEVYVFHLHNAHTDGDAVVHFRNGNVIHTGDIFFVGKFPYIDLSVNGSVNGLIKAVNHILALCDEETKIIPGHGPLTNMAALSEYRNMLVTVRDRIAPLVEAGKSLDEVKAAAPSAEYDEGWGGGFINPDRFVTTVYNSLLSEKE